MNLLVMFQILISNEIYLFLFYCLNMSQTSSQKLLDDESIELSYISEELGRIEYKNTVTITHFVEKNHFTHFIDLTYNYYLCPLKIYIFEKCKKILTMSIFVTVLSIIISYFWHFNEKKFELVLISKWMVFLVLTMIFIQLLFSISSIKNRYTGHFIFKYIYNLNPAVKFIEILANIKRVCAVHYKVSIPDMAILNIITFKDDIYRYLIFKNVCKTFFYTSFSEKCYKYFFPMDFRTIDEKIYQTSQKINYFLIFGMILLSPIICIVVFISQMVDLIKTGNDFSDFSILDYTALAKVKLRKSGILPHIYSKRLLISKKYAIRAKVAPVKNALDVLRRFLIVLCSTLILVLSLILLKMIFYQRNLFNFKFDLYSLDLIIFKDHKFEIKFIHLLYFIAGLFYIKKILDCGPPVTHSKHKSFKKWTKLMKSDEKYTQTTQVFLNDILKNNMFLILRECMAPFIVPFVILSMNYNMKELYDKAKKSTIFRESQRYFKYTDAKHTIIYDKFL
ncbi:putative Autophagy-related protein 9 protein [Pseudoloma neurophilia]|uniref:Putative Autophagy-related protein 9 protein n=1 Tax=Pseudoloma neurophilia TaxID=146866 RepID=A0A0R0M7Y5_9MICR|nr:putative Autophagy-related protein 9 protein [Pseudoloma neurophilia]